MSWGLLALPYLPGEWVRTNQCAGRRDVTKSPELGPRGAEGNLSAFCWWNNMLLPGVCSGRAAVPGETVLRSGETLQHGQQPGPEPQVPHFLLGTLEQVLAPL